MARAMLRLALFDALRGVGNLRWIVVPVLLFCVGWVELDYVEYDYFAQRPREANVWDGPLSMMAAGNIVIFVFVLGFTLVVGDLYVRDLSTGTAPMTLLRSRSRTLWWTAKLAALGALALVYSAVGFIAALAASATRLPLSLQWSPASSVPWSSQSALYPGAETLAPPLFTLLVILYTGLALWAVGAVVLLVSLLYPRMIAPLGFGFAWIVGLSWLVAPISARQGPLTLDPVFQVSYAVHFSGPGFDAVPWSVSFAVIGGSLALSLLLGAWQLRRADL